VAALEGRWQIELHFYHLWSRDCGRLGHDLDAEHLSAIVFAPAVSAPRAQWVAEAWYAAAHQGSACDASSGALASTLGDIGSGPHVFVSRGKHASYFDRGQCKWACGGDVCGEAGVLRPAAVVNIGERDAPLNGALWVHSRRWSLAEKLSSDFDPSTRAKLDASKGRHVVPLMQQWRAPQSPVLAGDTAIDGLVIAAGAASTAVTTATRAVSRFLRIK
jgi:hypothetical protein